MSYKDKQMVVMESLQCHVADVNWWLNVWQLLGLMGPVVEIDRNTITTHYSMQTFWNVTIHTCRTKHCLSLIAHTSYKHVL